MSVAFLFPGQGSQFVGMGSDYIKTYPSVARRFEQASDCLGTDLMRVVAKGPRATLVQTDYAQVAIYTLSVAIAEVLAKRGLLPSVTAGHSLGQFSALSVAGATTFETGLSLVVDRGRYMHEQNQLLDGSMFAVTGLGLDVIESLVRDVEDVWIANLNATGQIILSGLRPALQETYLRVGAMGGKGVWFDVAGPYHTPLMEAASSRFSRSIDSVAMTDARIPLIANTTAEPMMAADTLRDELHRHMLAPVRWSETMHRISTMNIYLLVEIGPGKVLKGLALRNTPDIRCVTTENIREQENACAILREVTSCVSS